MYSYELFEVKKPVDRIVERRILFITKKITETDLIPVGFGFRILKDGDPIIVQDYHPAEPGFVPMSEAEAREQALAQIRGLEAAEKADEMMLLTEAARNARNP
jgi:hypothetical protein